MYVRLTKSAIFFCDKNKKNIELKANNIHE